MILDDQQIERVKQHTMYTLRPPHHEHPDCIRIAIQWLSAQQLLKRPSRKAIPFKQLIEEWCGRYVSRHDVEVAATLLGLEGRYPLFNISSRLTRPSRSRLKGIGEALKHKDYILNAWHEEMYSRVEPRF